MIQITNRFTGAVIFEKDADSMRLAVEAAVESKVSLSGAALRHAALSDADLSDADLRHADLRDANLRDANLRHADLRHADLRDANLRDANLRDANLSGIPAIKNIHQTVYAAASQPKALDMGVWHCCRTTHCRAGWVVTLAGEAGAAMEYCLGTSAAAALIYLKSDPQLGKMPDFHATNEDALADMRRLSEAEAGA